MNGWKMWGRIPAEKEAHQSAAKALVDRLLEGLKPDDRMIITMLDLEREIGEGNR